MSHEFSQVPGKWTIRQESHLTLFFLLHFEFPHPSRRSGRMVISVVCSVIWAQVNLIRLKMALSCGWGWWWGVEREACSYQVVKPSSERWSGDKLLGSETQSLEWKFKLCEHHHWIFNVEPEEPELNHSKLLLKSTQWRKQLQFLQSVRGIENNNLQWNKMASSNKRRSYWWCLRKVWLNIQEQVVLQPQASSV